MVRLALVAVVIAALLAGSSAAVLPVKARAAVYGAMIGDALACGTHMCYDKSLIKIWHKVAGEKAVNATLFNYTEPHPGQFEGSLIKRHLGKSAGDVTHIGEQLIWLLEDLGKFHRFDPLMWSRNQLANFNANPQLAEPAVKEAMVNYAKGEDYLNAGHPTANTMSLACRFVPMILVYKHEQEYAMTARMQALTISKSRSLLDHSEFWARVLHRVVHRKLSPTQAIMSIVDDRSTVPGVKEVARVAVKAIGTKNDRSITAAKSFGEEETLTEGKQKFKYAGALGSGSSGATAVVAHLVARHEDDLQEALVQNVLLGGDSAARGVVIGALLGGHLGEAKIPARWLTQLVRLEEIKADIAKVGEVHKLHDEL